MPKIKLTSKPSVFSLDPSTGSTQEKLLRPVANQRGFMPVFFFFMVLLVGVGLLFYAKKSLGFKPYPKPSPSPSPTKIASPSPVESQVPIPIYSSAPTPAPSMQSSEPTSTASGATYYFGSPDPTASPSANTTSPLRSY